MAHRDGTVYGTIGKAARHSVRSQRPCLRFGPYSMLRAALSVVISRIAGSLGSERSVVTLLLFSTSWTDVDARSRIGALRELRFISYRGKNCECQPRPRNSPSAFPLVLPRLFGLTLAPVAFPDLLLGQLLMSLNANS